jgi:hypothetical protein
MWEGIIVGTIIAFGLAIIALIVSLSLYVGNKIEKAGDKIGERLEVNTNGIIKIKDDISDIKKSLSSAVARALEILGDVAKERNNKRGVRKA